ncbi:MAG: KdsC family phosphatase [Planctomycetota bacterium]|jgi:3-deoxy-D-manno-octulosonate 8-phosphate phosphatase (KDO 8-P phosphatase)
MNIDNAIREIKLVILDVDGVLTDGGIYVNDDGTESKRFNARDGAGIKYLQRGEISVAFLSGRKAKAVANRAKELGVSDCLQGIKVKMPEYERLIKKHGLSDRNICYVGDDLMDIPVMRRVGFPVAVANADPEVWAVALHVTKLGGGHGAVREVAEFILKKQEKWNGIIARYGLSSGDGS